MGISYASKPVAFFDTETGSDYLIPDFEAAGIPLVVAKTKTLADLVKAMDEAETNCSALIIDSITHPYREMIAAFLRILGRSFLQIDDWQYVKGDHGWEMFTNRFINSKLHIIMCGRAGDDLEQYTDEQGKRQLEKVGVKMKGEAETGFEPSLLIEMKLMERNNREQTGRKRTFVNMATVVKDRWDQINGDEIDNPEFADFLPHISRLALGGEHVGVLDTGDSQSILKAEKRDWQPVQRKIALGEIQDLMVTHVPGQTAAEKQRRILLLKTHFHAGWVEIEETMALIDMRAGFDSLHRELEGEAVEIRDRACIRCAAAGSERQPTRLRCGQDRAVCRAARLPPRRGSHQARHRHHDGLADGVPAFSRSPSAGRGPCVRRSQVARRPHQGVRRLHRFRDVRPAAAGRDAAGEGQGNREDLEESNQAHEQRDCAAHRRDQRHLRGGGRVGIADSSAPRVVAWS